jgi:hypothetical protein
MVILPQIKNVSRTANLSAKDEGDMASVSKTSLESAIGAVEQAFTRLMAATDIVVETRSISAAEREAAQVEISQSWQEHSSQLEAALAEANSENTFLKEDNLRLSNQLQRLQQEFLGLQKAAGKTVGTLDASVKQLDLILEMEH